MTEDRSAGRALARAYYEDLVGPLVSSTFPGLRHAAGRLGAGSDVLGFDDETSRDHDWGLRLTLLVPAAAVSEVRRFLAVAVPASFRGLPTRFPRSGGTLPRLHVEVTTVADLAVAHAGFDPRSPVTTLDWLSLTGQSVLEITAGPVFADPDGELGALRAALAWYPEDVWRFVLACDWTRLAQELPLMSRAADVGDDRGARLIAARLAHVTMHLAFTIERRWAPYAKWFGTAFGTLDRAAALGPALELLLGADDDARQRGASAALQVLLEAQNRLGLTDVDQATVPFWDRPHRHPDPAIAERLMSAVHDPAIRELPLGPGSIEQRTDNVDVLVDPRRRRLLVGGG